MAVKAHLAHTGQVAECREIATLDRLQAWVESHFAIPSIHQILLSARGRQVKSVDLDQPEILLVFIYDRRLLSGSDSFIDKPSLQYDLDTPPQEPADFDDEYSGDAVPVLRSRAAWATRLQHEMRRIGQEVDQMHQQTTTVSHAADIALINVHNHLGHLDSRAQTILHWAVQTIDLQAELLQHHETAWQRLDRLPLEQMLARNLHWERSDLAAPHPGSTLQTLLDKATIDAVKKRGESLASSFRERVDLLRESYQDAITHSGGLDRDHKQTEIGQQVADIMHEVGMLSKKFAIEENVDMLHRAAKIVHLQTVHFLPTLEQLQAQLIDLWQESYERRQVTQRRSLEQFRLISQVETKIARVHTDFTSLELDAECTRVFEALELVSSLPEIYGTCMLEYARRYTAPMLSHAELQRRTEWQRSVSSILILQDAHIALSNDTIEAYIHALDSIPALRTLAARLHQEWNPRVKRKSAEEGLSTLFGRNVRLEEQLKSAESRIHKLEDLLQRQTQAVRPSSAEGLGRTPRVWKAEEEAKVATLERELAGHRRRSEDFEKAAAREQTMLKNEAQDANAVKNDLLSNMEDQRREFEQDRRILLAKTRELRSQQDEMEAELDRLHEERSELQAQVNHLQSMADVSEPEAARILQNLLSQLNPHGKVPDSLADLVAQLRDLIDSRGLRPDKESIAMREVELVALEAQLETMQEERNVLQAELDTVLTDRQAHLQRHQESQTETAEEAAEMVSKRLYAEIEGMYGVLESMNLTVKRENGQMSVSRTPKSATATTTNSEHLDSSSRIMTLEHPTFVSWMRATNLKDEMRLFDQFSTYLDQFSGEVFAQAIVRRVREVEHLARRWQRECRGYRDQARRWKGEARRRLALREFKEGDLALFLPTRDQAIKSWAAFNVRAPHYFLREEAAHRLSIRDWLIGRISRIQERVVDSTAGEDDNVYGLPAGARWFLVDAAEERPGAPISIGSGKATVAVAADLSGAVVQAKIGAEALFDQDIRQPQVTGIPIPGRNSTSNNVMGPLSTRSPASQTLSRSLERRHVS